MNNFKLTYTFKDMAYKDNSMTSLFFSTNENYLLTGYRSGMIIVYRLENL